MTTRGALALEDRINLLFQRAGEFKVPLEGSWDGLSS